MKYSSASLLFAALLLVSLAAKTVSSAPTPTPDPRRFVSIAAGHLRAEGFAVAFDRRPHGIYVHARRGECRLMAADYTPYGTFAERFEARARRYGPPSFLYRGASYGRAPKLVPLLDFYLWREWRRLGLAAPRHPILAVAASPGCDRVRLDWTGLSALPD